PSPYYPRPQRSAGCARYRQLSRERRSPNSRLLVVQGRIERRLLSKPFRAQYAVAWLRLVPLAHEPVVHIALLSVESCGPRRESRLSPATSVDPATLQLKWSRY